MQPYAVPAAFNLNTVSGGGNITPTYTGNYSEATVSKGQNMPLSTTTTPVSTVIQPMGQHSAMPTTVYKPYNSSMFPTPKTTATNPDPDGYGAQTQGSNILAARYTNNSALPYGKNVPVATVPYSYYNEYTKPTPAYNTNYSGNTGALSARNYPYSNTQLAYPASQQPTQANYPMAQVTPLSYQNPAQKAPYQPMQYQPLTSSGLAPMQASHYNANMMGTNSHQGVYQQGYPTEVMPQAPSYSRGVGQVENVAYDDDDETEEEVSENIEPSPKPFCSCAPSAVEDAKKVGNQVVEGTVYAATATKQAAEATVVKAREIDEQYKVQDRVKQGLQTGGEKFVQGIQWTAQTIKDTDQRYQITQKVSAAARSTATAVGEQVQKGWQAATKAKAKPAYNEQSSI